MKKRITFKIITVVLLILLFLANCTPNSTKSSPTQTLIHTPTATITPILKDNGIIRDFYDNYPKSDCVSTENGWKCSIQVSDMGMWHLSYARTDFVEVYHSYYIDFEGLLKENISTAMASIEAIINIDSLQDSIDNWMVNEGINTAANNKGSIIEYETHGLNVYLYFDSSDTIMFETICYGGDCKELDLSPYNSDIIFRPKEDINNPTTNPIIRSLSTKTAIAPSPYLCIDPGKVIDEYLLHDFSEFIEKDEDDYKILELDELYEVENEAHGRFIAVLLINNCTYQIITTIITYPDISENELNRNISAISIASSIGLEEYNSLGNFLDQLEIYLTELRDMAMKNGEASKEFFPVKDLEYPKVSLELKIYDDFYEILTYNVIFLP